MIYTEVPITLLDKYWAVDKGPRHAALRKISMLNLLLEDYRAKHGECPSVEDGLTKMMKEYPAIELNSISDPWGRKFGYMVSKNRLDCQAYSFGENGLDENMKGDDIFFKNSLH
jgi:hypothetical protein